MQESNFEKQVQQKLDELRLTPSEPVWQNIEVAIRKKKDRRLVFWMLPFLLLAGGLVWWQTATWHSEKVGQQPAAKTLPQPTFSKPHTGQQVQNTTTNTNGQPATLTTVQVSAQPQERKKAETPGRKDVKQEPIAKQGHFQGKSVTENREAVFQEPLKNKKSNESKHTVTAAPDNTMNRGTAETNVASPNTTSGITKNAETRPNSLDLERKTDTATTAKSAPELYKKTQAARHLQWGMVSRIGISNAVASLTNGLGQKASLASYPQADYSSSPGVNSAGFRQPTVPTRDIQFSVGVMLKKGVGKKSFILAGLQYSYYSYNLTVGTEPSTTSLINLNRLAAQNAFFNNGKQNQFTNSLQFVELPLGFEYQLLKKYPLHVQHGFTISQMLSGKVLQYDHASNAYYQQSEGLRKHGLNFFTGVDYTILKDKALSLQAGPQLQYGLQPLFKNSSSHHLLSGGLAVTMGF